MNSNGLQAPHRFWPRVLALSVVTLLSVAGALASPATNIAPSSMFRPRGMVRVTIASPNGGAPIVDYWASDGANGFCRADGPPGKAQLNVSTCFINATGEPFADLCWRRAVSPRSSLLLMNQDKEFSALRSKPI